MKTTSMLNRNGKTRKRTRKNMMFHLLLAAIVVCGLASEIVHAQEYYPILKLDFSNNNNESQTEEGFISFTSLDSGSEFEGITVELEATSGTLNSRWRWAPTGIPYELVYRDLVFSRPGEMRLTLSGLEPNTEYQITIYAYDVGSAGDRIADWTNATTGEFVLTTSFSGGSAPSDEFSHAFSGLTQSDENGTLVMEGGPNENTIEESGADNPYAFINALVVSSSNPITKSWRPDPEDGALISTTEVALSWQYGQTSVSSNVFLGESYEDVNNATTADTDIFRGNTEVVPFIVGSPGHPFPEGLTPGKTYYWRIDEVEENGTAHKGDVWSFTVTSQTAFNPRPLDGSIYIDPNIVLVWTPGAGSIEHRVFFGDNLQDVQAGTGGTDKGIVTDPNYAPPGLLERNKTYYWRIDESDGTNTYTGDVWSFTTNLENMGTVTMDVWENVAGDHQLVNLLDDPRYPDNPTRSEALTEFGTVDGVGDGYGAQISGWLYCPETGEYTFLFSCGGGGELWLSTDEDPDNTVLLGSEINWSSYNSFSIKSDPVSLVAGEKYYIMARWKDFEYWDHCQVAWQGTGVREQEVIQGNYLSPFEPVNAFGPNPANGSVDVAINSVLSWKPGKFAVTQDIYLGTDMNDITDVNTSNLTSYPNIIHANVNDANYDPGLLDFNTNYYWRVDTVNNVHPDGLWTGKVWSFTTGNYIVIDDFERYTDFPPDEVWNTWADGYNNPTVNGSTMGYPEPDFANGGHFVETTIVNGGSQSGPFLYNNTTASYSEVTLSTSNLTIGQDWTQKGINTLTLWFYGDPNNPATEQLYVKLNNSKIVYSGNTADISAGEWIQWDIDLSAFNINLSNVTQVGIGMEKTGAIGGEGILFLDDIRLRYVE